LPGQRLSRFTLGSDHIYVVEARFDPAASDDDVCAMFRMLADRFKMSLTLKRLAPSD